MKKPLIIFLFLAVWTVVMLAPASGKNKYLDTENDTCGTNYGCSLCHINPKGGGPLSAEGKAFEDADYDPCYFCYEICTEWIEESDE